MKEALKKLSETRAAATNELIPDVRARAGWEMRRRQAQSELPAVKAEFDKAFRKVGFPVFVQGPGTEEFIKLAAQEADVVSVKGLLGDLRRAVKANIGPSREFGVGGYTALVRELRQVGATLGLTSVPSPEFKGVEYVADDAAVDAVVDNYLRTSVGPEFLSAVIEMEACQQAETLVGDQPIVPVIITGIASDTAGALGPKLFSGKFLTINAPQEITPEFITTTFKNIKKSLKQ